MRTTMTTAATDGMPSQEMQEREPNEYEKIPESQRKKLDFLMGLHPNGREVEDIIEQAVKVFKTTREVAEKEIKKELYDYQNEKLISAQKRSDGSTIITLTKSGAEIVSKFLEILRKYEKDKFFVYLKKWVNQGNKSAARLYNKEMTKLFLEQPQIACMLMTPHYEDDIISEYSRYLGKSQPDADATSAVIRYVGLLQNMKIINVRVENVNGRSRRIYYPTTRGRKTINDVFEQIRQYINNTETTRSSAASGKKHKKKWIYWFTMLLSFIAVVAAWISYGTPGNYTLLLLLVFSSFIPVGIMIFIETVIPKIISILFTGKKRGG